jgi:hypothetical protein
MPQSQNQSSSALGLDGLLIPPKVRYLDFLGGLHNPLGRPDQRFLWVADNHQAPLAKNPERLKAYLDIVRPEVNTRVPPILVFPPKKPPRFGG